MTQFHKRVLIGDNGAVGGYRPKCNNLLEDVDCCRNYGNKTKLLFGNLVYLAMDVGIISEE